MDSIVPVCRLERPRKTQCLHLSLKAGKTNVPVQVQRLLSPGENLFGSRGAPSFILVPPSTDWTRSPYIIEGNLLYLKSIDLKVNLT